MLMIHIPFCFLILTFLLLFVSFPFCPQALLASQIVVLHLVSDRRFAAITSNSCIENNTGKIPRPKTEKKKTIKQALKTRCSFTMIKRHSPISSYSPSFFCWPKAGHHEIPHHYLVYTIIIATPPLTSAHLQSLTFITAQPFLEVNQATVPHLLPGLPCPRRAAFAPTA